MNSRIIDIGTLVKYSPVGSGKLTGITDVGYPKVNDTAVGWLICQDEDTQKLLAWKSSHQEMLVITIVPPGINAKETGLISQHMLTLSSIQEAQEVFSVLGITQPRINILVQNGNRSGIYTLPFAKYSSEGKGIITTDSYGVPNINGKTPTWFVKTDDIYVELMDWGKNFGYEIVIDSVIPAKEDQAPRTVYVTSTKQAEEIEQIFGARALVIYDKPNNKEYLCFPSHR